MGYGLDNSDRPLLIAHYGEPIFCPVCNTVVDYESIAEIRVRLPEDAASGIFSAPYSSFSFRTRIGGCVAGIIVSGTFPRGLHPLPNLNQGFEPLVGVGLRFRKAMHSFPRAVFRPARTCQPSQLLQQGKSRSSQGVRHAGRLLPQGAPACRG